MHLQPSEITYNTDGCFSTELLRQTEDYEDYMWFSFLMGFLTVVFGCLGLVGNTVSLVVLNTKDFQINYLQPSASQTS